MAAWPPASASGSDVLARGDTQAHLVVDNEYSSVWLASSRVRERREEVTHIVVGMVGREH
jgi:hypothetical protein